MRAHELTELLAQLPAGRPPGLDLLARFDAQTFETAADDGEMLVELLEQQGAIDKAISDLDAYVVLVAKVVKRCCLISPTRGTIVPHGF